LKDQILENGVPEQVAFTNPTVFSSLFVNPYYDPAGYQTIALKQQPTNLSAGKSTYRGIDWDFSYRTKTSIGGITAQWTGTQMLKQQYALFNGTNTDLGAFGPDQTVVFRTVSNFAISLSNGAWLHTFTAHYKSGYTDIPQTPDGGAINVMAADGSLSVYNNTVQLHVPSYTTFDWQTQYDFSKQFKLTAGIKNIWDHNPPFTLQDGGGGDMRGYDGRYADPLGRTFYLTGNYKF
jgi:iron complex outermembrane receptor protein